MSKRKFLFSRLKTFSFQLVEFVVGRVELRRTAGRNGVVRSVGIDSLVVDRSVLQRSVRRRSMSTAGTLVVDAFPLHIGGNAQISRLERRRRFSTRGEKRRRTFRRSNGIHAAEIDRRVSRS